MLTEYGENKKYLQYVIFQFHFSNKSINSIFT